MKRRKWYEKDDACLVEEEAPSFLPMDQHLDNISSELEDYKLNLSKVESPNDNQSTTSTLVPAHIF